MALESADPSRLQLAYFNRRLALGFLAALLLIGMNMFFAFQSVRHLIENNTRVTEHYDVLAALRSIILAVQEVESLQRGYVISGDGNALPDYYVAASGVGQYLNTLKSLQLDGQISHLVPVLETHITRRLAAGHQALELRRDGDFEAARQLIASGQGAQEMEQIRKLIAQMISRETTLLIRRISESQTNAWYALSTLIVATLANLILLALVYRMITRDFQRRRQVEADLQRARDAAEAANQAKSMFLANMSHELRTPLNAILGYTELLQEEVLEQDLSGLNHDLEIIHSESRHLLELISDILDLSKIEAGKMELVIESFAIAPLLEELGHTVATQIGKQGNAFQLKLAPDLGSMRSDQAKLRQSLLNLLSNAAKFTRNGSVTLEAHREQRNGRDWVVFQVADTGIGISPAQQLRLFQPFTQADSSTTRKYGGTGLGLALTRRFCEMLGGEVMVRSAPEQGSIFSIRLPLEWQAKEREAGARRTNQLEQNETAPFERVSGS
ncbi:MAG: ATP-binding protein [Candidatus Sericytochromatia bacterium]